MPGAAQKAYPGLSCFSMKMDKRLLEPEKKKYTCLSEKDDWEAHGCSDNHDWHEYLNELMWVGLTPKLA